MSTKYSQDFLLSSHFLMLKNIAPILYSLYVDLFDEISKTKVNVPSTKICVCTLFMQMTASHLPYTRNGLKFFTKKGGLTSPQVEEICEMAARKYANRLTKVSTLLNLPSTRVNFMSVYANHLREIIKERVNHPSHYDTPLKGFQVFDISRVLLPITNSLSPYYFSSSLVFCV